MSEQMDCPQLVDDLNADQIRELAQFFSQLSDPTRLTIVLACIGEPISVSEIGRKTGLRQSSISHHLKLLRLTGLLRDRREGQYVYYSIADSHVAHIVQDAGNHILQPGHIHDEAGAVSG